MNDKAELMEKLTIATICNEATDCILKQIVKEDDFIEILKKRLLKINDDPDSDDPDSKAARRRDRIEEHLEHSQEKREKLTILLKPKIDTDAINKEIEELI